MDKIYGLAERFGGILRCEDCGITGEVLGEYFSIGWPKCCGYTMRWWTQRQIDDGEMMIFGREYPTPEQEAQGYEHDPYRRARRSSPCETYWWVGQDFSFCDNCSKPCWEHPYRPGVGENAGLRQRQSWEEARAMWERWGEPRGIPFRVPRPCIAQREKAWT